LASSEQLTVADLLAAVGSDAPAPGAGAAAALACGLAAALVEKACAVTLRREDDATLRALRERARDVRIAGPRLADEDAAAYAGVIEAQRLAGDDPAGQARVGAALSAAAEAPLVIA